MKSLSIVGRNASRIKEVKEQFQSEGFTFTVKKPDVVISLGGDGTFLYAERCHPGIPKLLLRDSTICNKCNDELLHHVVQKLRKNQMSIENHITLEALVSGSRKAMRCANDVVIRNKKPTDALRFTISINNKQVNEEFIGDGVTISTPFGSTGYFHSITGMSFSKGIGIAFNNTTKRHPPVFVSDKDVVKVTITRNDAHVATDNNPQILTLKKGQSIVVKKSRIDARILTTKPTQHPRHAHLRDKKRRQSIKE